MSDNYIENAYRQTTKILLLNVARILKKTMDQAEKFCYKYLVFIIPR